MVLILHTFYARDRILNDNIFSFLQLTSARETVSNELEKLEKASEECIEGLNKSFQEIHDAIDKRKSELISKIEETKETKRYVLNEQLLLIDDEKEKVSIDYLPRECNHLFCNTNSG